MFINFQFSFLSIILIFNKITYIKCDCGIPALPVHMKVRPLTNIYYENDVVEYYCEYNDMILIGNDKRQCTKSKWDGTIPECVREIPRRFVDRIEMVDIKNHSITNIYTSRQMYYDPNYLRDYERYQRMTYYGNYEQNPIECIHSKIKSNVTDLGWRVVFKYPVTQVYSVQIVVYKLNIDYRIDLNKSESVIKSVFVSNYRECVPQPVETMDKENKLFKYSFICELKNLDINQNTDKMNGLRYESLSNITINFAINEVTVCELHISETIPFRSYSSGSCGSPDIPLFANYSPVFDTINGSPIPVGYSIICDEGFNLVGNSAVMCGANNKWMDTFPTCHPNASCLLMNNSRLDQLNLLVTYRDLYSFDGNITAINATQAIYSCPKKDKLNNPINRTLLGDSIRFCQSDGKWSGEEPVCLDENDFTLYLAELNEDILKGDSKLPKFAQHMHTVQDCHIPAIPKFAKIYTYEQDLISIYMANIKERIDLLPTYPNGSVITYNCDSKFTYMASDFESRTCINGSWVGPIGKCYTPIGGTEVTRAVSVQEIYKKGSEAPRIIYRSIPIGNSDKFWNYAERDNKKCLTYDIEAGVQLSLSVYLSMPTRVSYFMIRLGAKNIFHELEERMIAVHRASQLTKLSPITADIDLYFYNQKSECEVTKVIEAGAFNDYSDGITLVSFKCNEPEYHNSNQNKRGIYYPQNQEMKTNGVNIHINPAQFHQNFNSTNITFCGLMVFQSSDDCGVPENIPNSEIIGSQTGYVRYRCKDGYKLVGNEYVRCSKFGNWMDQFPKCELYKLCEMKMDNSSELLKRQYYNTLVINGEEVAVLGTIVKYKCRNENIYEGLHIMIGPRTAICTANGKWSVDEPICADDKYFTRESLTQREHKTNIGVLPFVILIVILIVIIVISFIFIYRRYGCSNPLMSIVNRRKHTRNSSTFISYGQSNLRDSVLSFNDGIIPSNNHSIA